MYSLVKSRSIAIGPTIVILYPFSKMEHPEELCITLKKSILRTVSLQTYDSRLALLKHKLLK